MSSAERYRLGSALTLAAALMAPPTSGWSAPATTTPTGQLRAAVESVRAARPECRSFPAAILEEHGQSAEDPLLAFEKWRRSRHSTIMAPPMVTCGHAAWNAMHGAPALALPAGSPAAAPPSPKAAVAGTNAPLASGVSGYQGEPAIAVDPNNPLRLVAGANTFQAAGTGCQSPTGGAATTGPAALFASPDGGTTWNSTCAPWPASVTGGVPNAVAWFGGDPSVAWDRSGNAYASYLLLSQEPPLAAGVPGNVSSALVVAKSTDGGATWSPLGTVANHITTSVPFNDKPMLAIDTSSSGTHAHPDRLYAVWMQVSIDPFFGGVNRERVAYSDTGATGSWTMVSMAEPLVSGPIDNGGDIAVAGDGTVYAAWNRGQCQGGGPGYDTNQTLLSSSTDGGASWSAPVVVRELNFIDFCSSSTTQPPQESRGINAFPSIAVDKTPGSPFAGRVYVVLMDFPGPRLSTSTRTNIYLYRSADNGAHWSAPVKVNDDSSTIATQFFPRVAVDQTDGTVSVSWYDTRNSPTDRQTQIYYARSIDGGVSFETNVRVTDGGAQFTNHAASSDENFTDNVNADPNQYGDYMGLAVSNRQAHVIWTDSREFFPTAGNGKVEDVATAVVTNCSPPLWSAPPALSCGGTSARVSWTAPAFGANATAAKYDVSRFTNPGCTLGESVLATGLTTTSYTDASPVDASIVHYYRVVATNNCPGTTLTPMASASACSAGAGGVAPHALIAAPPAVCPGSTGNVASLPDNGALAQYAWVATGGTITGGANARTMTFTAGATGTVHLDSTVALCTGAAAGSLDIPISATALASPSISGAHSACEGYAMTLSATPGYSSYQWSHAGTPILGATSATYTKAATAGDTGSYTVTGTNGCTTAASAPFALTIGAGSLAPPAVTAPAPITLVQTACSGPDGGVTAITSPALTAFLAAGTANAACDSSPVRLAPQVGSSDVTSSTLFGGGATPVAFRFQDSAGHVGSATSTVNVQLFGDLNLSGAVNSTDLDVLRSYLAGNAHAGTPPFTAPLGLADLNGDGTVNAVDAVILSGKLTGSIVCLPRR